MAIALTARVHETAWISPGIELTLGDYAEIGPDVRITGEGKVEFGDYSKVHRGCFINGHGTVKFGHNAWIGERSVIDGSGGLFAGNNVGVGIASQLNTHIAHGDTLAGCRFKNAAELLIGDDAWFVGMCLVSPTTVEEKSVAMLGSVITRPMRANRIYGGCPATDITDKMGGPPWTDPPAASRIERFNELVRECAAADPGFCPDLVQAVEASRPDGQSPDVSYFNVVTRTYTKRLTLNEHRFMKWLISWRARFTPEEK